MGLPLPAGSAVIAMLAALVVLTGIHVADAQVQFPSSVTVTLTPRSRDWWDLVAQLIAPIGTIVAVGGLIATVWLNTRSVKLAYFTKEWSTLMQFLQQKAKFMDPERTKDYRTRFTGDEAIEYEMIARLCIGYLDDVFFIGGKGKFRTWLRGSVGLLAGTHRAWLKDHETAYAPSFYEFIFSELDG